MTALRNKEERHARDSRCNPPRAGSARSQERSTVLGRRGLGLLALLFPVVSTFVIARVVGWLLVFSGLVTIWDAFTVEGTGAFFGELLVGLLKLALGVYLLRHPDVSIVVLTLLLAAVFMIDGAVQVAMAFELRPLDEWVWMLLAGLISIGVGLLIAAELPRFSLVAVGIYIGISFLSTGIARIMISRRLSSLAGR